MRYQYIGTQIWRDEKFRLLTETAQKLFIYLLTSPHANLLGLYFLPLGYLSEDLKAFDKSSGKAFARPFEAHLQDIKDLIEKDLVLYDLETGVVWVKKSLKHNPITNPNQKSAAKRNFNDLPKSWILKKFIDECQYLPKDLHQALMEALPEGLHEGDRQPMPMPMPMPMPNKEGETSVSLSSSVDSDEEKIKIGGNGKKTIPDCPAVKIVELYHDILPFLPQVNTLDKITRANLRNRWTEDAQRWELSWWEHFFHYIAQSDFLCGRKTDWKASFNWIVGPKNFSKVLNGAYTNGKTPMSPKTQRNMAAGETVKRLIDEGKL